MAVQRLVALTFESVSAAADFLQISAECVASHLLAGLLGHVTYVAQLAALSCLLIVSSKRVALVEVVNYTDRVARGVRKYYGCVAVHFLFGAENARFSEGVVAEWQVLAFVSKVVGNELLVAVIAGRSIQTACC